MAQPKPWHYAQIAHDYFRVGDANDDFVTSFTTATAAMEYINAHNIPEPKDGERIAVAVLTVPRDWMF